MRLETGYVPRKSMRRLRFWLLHVGVMDTFTQGPMLCLRVLGAYINIYPRGKSNKQQRAERDARSRVYNPKQYRRR